MVETKSGNNGEISSAEQKRNGFHGKYLEVCKLKNLQPLPEVKAKQRNIEVLDFHADRVKPYDWLAICNSLLKDKSLKFIAIRLRKNTELILEEMDTFKKTKAIVTHPVIYSKFLFTELVNALQSLMINNAVLETLIIEGLPLYGRYMSTFTKGLALNTSIKTLNMARSKLGDEACESICGTLKHMMNIETLNFSGCNLGIKGAEAVADLVKFQKIQRFSEAWTKSLRYQKVDAESFPGLRKIFLNNNPEIGNEGLELLTTSLCEDVWIKDIEMQNCGIDDVGAQHIIECLNINKTILNFNINGNLDVSEHLHRHILVHLGNVDQDSSDSTDSKSSHQKVTKLKLLDNVKFLEEQLENEIFRRKQMELLNDNMSKQLIQFQKELTLQGSFRIPNGFTLVSNDTLEDLLSEKPVVSKMTSIRTVHRRKRRPLVPKKVKSHPIVPQPSVDVAPTSKSEVLMKLPTNDKKLYIEQNIGDNASSRQKTATSDKPMTGAQLFRMFAKKKNEVHQPDDHANSSPPSNFDPRSLFSSRTTKFVPNNSDAESDK